MFCAGPEIQDIKKVGHVGGKGRLFSEPLGMWREGSQADLAEKRAQ